MKSVANHSPMGLTKFFDDFFNHSITDVFGSDYSLSQPAINVLEDKAQFTIEVAAPGFNKEDFDIQADKGRLTIKGEHSAKEEVKEEKIMRREFSFSSFSRSFQLPENIEASQIAAKYENGVLRIALPKVAKEEAAVKKIEIG
ncbi:Hsp20/alpha crystallin family protein [Phaeodactylibacter luteus]|nr:Hsp20/alpha crystallin family protein [Phaeodactylibacter luteus]